MSNLKIAARTIILILLAGIINLEADEPPILRVKEINWGNSSDNLFFYRPSTMLFAQEELYIVESGENKIRIYGSDGQLKRSIGRKGSGPEEFDTPIGLDFYEDQIYVSDSFNNMIKIFDKYGKYLGGFKTNFTPVQVAVLNKEKILVTNRPSPRFSSEKLVYCFNSNGKLQWKAIDTCPASDHIVYTLLNEIILKKDPSGYCYLIWKYQNNYIIKMDGNGQIIEKIMLDFRYPSKSVDLPLKSGRQKITCVCWSFARDKENFYLIAPDYDQDGDLRPGKEIIKLNEKGQITAIIKLPLALRLLTVNGKFLYGIDSEDKLHAFQLEGT